MKYLLLLLLGFSIPMSTSARSEDQGVVQMSFAAAAQGQPEAPAMTMTMTMAQTGAPSAAQLRGPSAGPYPAPSPTPGASSASGSAGEHHDAEDAPRAALPPVPLSTKGNQIIAADGTPVRILGIGVFTDVSRDVGRIRRAGFNTLRISWGNRGMYVDLPRIDRIVEAAARAGLWVILDNHYNEGRGPCVAQQRNGLWYDKGGASNDTDGCGSTGTVTDARFVADWVTVAQRYRGNRTVIGYDLRNEPLAYPGMSTWEAGDRNPDHNLRWMYERVGRAILAVDPDKLIICEGPQNYNNSFDKKGPAPWGDLTAVARLPVNLPIPGRVVYAVHDYPSEIAGFRPDSGPDRVRQMNRIWGYLVMENIAPVLVGEMASNMKEPASAGWADTITSYMNGTAPDGPRFAADQQPIGGIWWWAGSDDNAGNQPSGIWDARGRLRPEQAAVWRKLLPRQ